MIGTVDDEPEGCIRHRLNQVEDMLHLAMDVDRKKLGGLSTSST
jgi:hypothetical protein